MSGPIWVRSIGAMMGARWAKLGPIWQQLPSNIGHDGAWMAILASTWEVLKACWEDFLVIFVHLLDRKKLWKSGGNYRIFVIL